MSIDCILKTYLRQYSYDTASDKNRVALDCFLNTLNYDLLISKIRATPTADRDLRDKKVNEER